MKAIRAAFAGSAALQHITLELDMANPKELQEAAEAIRDVRRLPAVRRHQQIDDLLEQAEEWARKEYCKVSEKKLDQNDAGAIGPNSTQARRLESESLHQLTLVFSGST